MHPYDFKSIEPAMLDLWKDKRVYERLVKRNKGKKKFYYLDGPPYTTGKIHIGHAWGKALRDAILRYKRMRGFDVWDRPGFDMHGLPIEVSVEQELGIKDKKEILNKVGLKKFIEACQKYALEQLWPMVDDFKRLGVWMDWENPYMTIRNEYVEGAWWALAKANEKGLLYLGKKSMTWCPRCATALAKHELNYDNRSDDSVYVKFPLEGKKNEYLVVWTTTPWTIPFNLAVMVHPGVDYVKARVGEEIWVVAEDLLEQVGEAADKELKVIEKVKGKKLAGARYMTPFHEESTFHQEREEKHAHSVLLSEKYVTTEAGTGLVHCAPGCGPEDFEVGKEHGLPAFNETDEHGCFSERMGSLAGLVAKQDDHRFIEALEDKGLLVAKQKVTHEYAHCWRCKTPVIFRATDQWFLAMEQLRDEMVKKNKDVYWVPDWAGNRWFDSWLGSLQDWCISRQRFWGIPLPIWVCGCGKHKVVGTVAELKKLTGKTVDNLHRPWIDEVTLECECGKEMRRTTDVLDVWLDSGVAAWATLDYPAQKETFEKLQFPDLILEGKDQIRGWFNSLMCMSMVSFGRVPYAAVYMHGFINDAQGRKMSKSLKNFITPYEIIDVYGADTLRYYQIGGAQPGLDLNFNHDDAKLKHKNLVVLWNVQKFLVDLAGELNANPAELKTGKFGVEERFMLSKLNSAIQHVTVLFDEYRLNEVPAAIEDLYLTLSRTYIQMVRDKASVGEEGERKVVLYTVFTCLSEALKLLAPVAPFITERIWQTLRDEFRLTEESVHLCEWPKADKKAIDGKLEQSMDAAGGIMQAILAAREKAKLSVRWPVKAVHVVSQDDRVLKAAKGLAGVVKYQTNVKELWADKEFAKVTMSVKPNAGPVGKDFGKDSPKVMAAIAKLDAKRVLEQLAKENKVTVNKVELTRDHLIIEREVPEQYVEAELRNGFVYLDTTRTDELDAEGYAREVMRRLQQLRKEAGLEKADDAIAYIQTDELTARALADWKLKIGEKCGATVKIGTGKPKESFKQSAEENVKGRVLKLFLSKA